jgi:hypothetical protein
MLLGPKYSKYLGESSAWISHWALASRVGKRVMKKRTRNVIATWACLHFDLVLLLLR